jgi:hypothetical protein
LREDDTALEFVPYYSTTIDPQRQLLFHDNVIAYNRDRRGGSDALISCHHALGQKCTAAEGDDSSGSVFYLNREKR